MPSVAPPECKELFHLLFPEASTKPKVRSSALKIKTLLGIRPPFKRSTGSNFHIDEQSEIRTPNSWVGGAGLYPPVWDVFARRRGLSRVVAQAALARSRPPMSERPQQTAVTIQFWVQLGEQRPSTDSSQISCQSPENPRLALTMDEIDASLSSGSSAVSSATNTTPPKALPCCSRRRIEHGLRVFPSELDAEACLHKSSSRRWSVYPVDAPAASFHGRPCWFHYQHSVSKREGQASCRCCGRCQPRADPAQWTLEGFDFI